MCATGNVFFNQGAGTLTVPVPWKFHVLKKRMIDIPRKHSERTGLLRLSSFAIVFQDIIAIQGILPEYMKPIYPEHGTVKFEM